MLTGHLTVQGNEQTAIVRSILEYVPPQPRQLEPSIPEKLNQACMKLLPKRPQDRFQTADEFLHALNGSSPINSQGSCSCTACGKPNNSNGRYCSFCGANRNTKQNQTARCFCCGTEVGEQTNCSGCNRSFHGADHRLHFKTGTLAGTIWRIPQGIFIVGRRQLSPRDYSISRNHLKVLCGNGHVSIQDEGSINKTYVDGIPTNGETNLRQNCELRIANNVAVYKCQYN